jgi:hypothetical protein
MTKVEAVDLFITFIFSKSTKNRGRAVPKCTKTIFCRKVKNIFFPLYKQKGKKPALILQFNHA